MKKTLKALLASVLLTASLMGGVVSADTSDSTATADSDAPVAETEVTDDSTAEQDTVTIDYGTYIVNSNRTVSLIEWNKEDNSREITIPKDIVIDNVHYTVYDIGDGVFKDFDELESVVIHDKIKSIGAEAFANSSTTHIELNCTLAPSIEENTFNPEATIVIPKGNVGYDKGIWANIEKEVDQPVKRSWFGQLKHDFHRNFIKDDRYKLITNGLLVTLRVTFFALLLGLALGAVIAIIRSTHDKTINDMHFGLGKCVIKLLDLIARLYLTVVRGTPVVVQLMIMYFIIFASSTDKIMVAVLAFGINSGAYVAEIMRSGIMSIDNGQFEAGRSLGFNYVSTMWHIIIPQALKNVLPALANEFIVLLKETSVSGFIGLNDMTRGGDLIRSQTYTAFLPLLAVAAIYLVIVIFFSFLVSLLERRLRNSER